MQIVINIDEEIYKRILPYKDEPVISNLANDYPEITHAIANGVPLPKGHGRLIDEDAIPGDGSWDFGDRLDETPTIIEADRSEEE